MMKEAKKKLKLKIKTEGNTQSKSNKHKQEPKKKCCMEGEGWENVFMNVKPQKKREWILPEVSMESSSATTNQWH